MRSWNGTKTGFLTTAVLLLGGGVVAAGCDGSILDVTDPDIVTPGQLQGPGAAQNRFAGILSDFREAYDFHVLYTGVISDEYIHVGTFPGHQNADDREPAPGDLSPQQEWITPLATTQKTTDELVEGFQAELDNPEFEGVRELMLDGIAFGHLLRGYNLLFWGETFCQSIFDQQDETSPKLPEDRIREDVIPALQAAIPAAQAASGGSRDLTSNPDDVVNAARIGLARAHMFLGEHQQALSFAQQVPPGHVFAVDYSSNTNDERNAVFGRTFGNVQALRWSIGLNDDAGSNFESYAYADEFLGQDLILPGGGGLSPQGSGPVNLQQLYTGPEAPIVLTSAWEAKVIEAEALWRDGAVQQAEDMLNDLLDGTLGIQNPMTVANSGLSLDPWREVDLTGDPANDLVEIGFARQAGLWQTAQRQAFLRRVFRNDGIDMFPDRAGEAMSFPLYSFELDNNENVSMGCPNSNVPGQG